MLKSKSNVTRIGGGQTLSDLSQGKRLWLSLILSFICAILMCCALIVPKFAKAQTTTDLNDPDKTITIDELTISGYNSYSANAKIFNKANLTSLYSVLSGGNGTNLTYIRNTLLGSTEVDYGLTTSADSGVKPKIPQYKTAINLYDMNGGKNIVVTLGGQQWTVTFLTTDNNGDVIVTLWLADAWKPTSTQPTTTVSTDTNGYARSQYSWYTGSVNSSGASGSDGTPGASNYVQNMYTTSKVRVAALNAGSTDGSATQYAWNTSGTGTTGTLSQTVSNSDRVASDWAIFTLDNNALTSSSKNGKSLISYLDTPSQLKYTYFEDFNYHYDTLGGNGTNSYFLNEAISTDLFGYATGTTDAYTVRHSYSSSRHEGRWHYATAYNVAYTSYSNASYGYNSWAYDYLWLPSWSEVGSITASSYQGLYGIWGLTDPTDTTSILDSLTGQLKSMDGSSDPVAWNGGTTAQNNINTSKYMWLRSGASGNTYYAHYMASGGGRSAALTARTLGVRPALHLNLTAAEAASVPVVNVPSGTVTTDYTGSALDVNDPDYFANISWYSSIYTNTNAVTLSPAQVTNANETGYTVNVTLGSGYAWSDSSSGSKTFTFIVRKKELSITWSTDSTTGYPVASYTDTSQIYSGDTLTNGRYPKLVTKFKKPGYADSSAVSAPTSFGNWVAIAMLDCGGDNYTLSTDTTVYTQPFNVSKKQLAYPVLSSGSASEEYDGSSQEFTFSGYDSDTMSFTAPTGADSFDGSTLKVTNAGSYTVSYTIKNTDLYEWSGTAPSAVTITPKSVVISPDSANPSSWERKTATSLKFTVPTALCGSDTNLNLVATYTLNGGADTAVPGAVAFDGTDYTVTIGAGFAKGNYVLTVKVADGENYSGSCTYNFEITAQGLSLGNTDIVWTINGKTYVISDFDNEHVEIEYTGQPLTVSANFDKASDAAHLMQDGAIGGDWATAIDVGDNYTAVLAVKANGDYAFTDGPFTLKIKIVPKVINFTNADWEWQYAGDSGWNTYSASNKPSVNDGKAVSVRISPSYLAGLGLSAADYSDSYIHANTLTDQGAKSTTATITITNGNYTTADETGIENITFNWEITAKALEYSWTGTQSVTANTANGEKAFDLPAVEFADGQAHSDYIDYVFTVGGTDYTKEELEQYIGENWDETKPAITGTVKVVLKDGVTEVTLKPASGNAPTAMFTTGTPKTAITVAITGSGAEYGKVGFAISVTRNTVNESQRATVTVSGGSGSETFDASDSALVKFVNGLGAGSYKITVSLKAGEVSSYTLVGDYDVEFEILKQKVELPTLKEVVFNGSRIYFKDCIDGFDSKLMKIIGEEDGGIDFGREWRENGYYTTIVLLDSDNYEFIKTTVSDGGEAPVKYALTDGEATVETLGSEYEYNWMINKFRITDKMWDKSGKKGAVIKLPSQFNALVADPEVLKISYQYFNDQHGEALEKYSFKGGNSYYVNATLSGSDADNFEFENQTLTSDKTVYTVPQSKAEQVLNNTLKVVKNNMWLFIGIGIGLLLLILLIIIIAVVAKKRKKREAELKEEKRLEREERMMRMQMGGAAQMPITAAGMIAAQQQAMPTAQPQPQPMQQSVQQSMPAPAQSQQQSYDGGTLARIEAELAAIREEQKNRTEAELANARMLVEFERLRGEMRQYGVQPNAVNNTAIPADVVIALLEAVKNGSATPVNLTPAPAPAALPHNVEESAPVSVNTPTMYPADAVITTTTTVDTTKKSDDKLSRRSKSDSREMSERNEFADVDGFYDSID